MDKLTSRFQSALSDAQSLAVGRDNQFMEPAHVLGALLDQQDGSTRPLLVKAGANVAKLRKDLAERVDYVVVRNQRAVMRPDVNDKALVILGAAKLGQTRLIDNIEVQAP